MSTSKTSRVECPWCCNGRMTHGGGPQTYRCPDCLGSGYITIDDETGKPVEETNDDAEQTQAMD